MPATLTPSLEMSVPEMNSPIENASSIAFRYKNILEEAICQLSTTETESPRQSLSKLLNTHIPIDHPSPVLRSIRESIERRIRDYHENDQQLYNIVLKVLDDFLRVRIDGARWKTSALFDRDCRAHKWNHIAILAGSSVAEYCVLAMNGADKKITVIDYGPAFEGKMLASRIASSTNSIVHYGFLHSVGKLLDGADALLIGAELVSSNGCVISSAGANIVAKTAKELGVRVIVVTQAVKHSDQIVVDAPFADNIVSYINISSIRTEFDTAIVPALAPLLVKKAMAAN